MAYDGRNAFFDRPILQQEPKAPLPYAMAPRQSRPPSAMAWKSSRPNSAMGQQSMTASTMFGAFAPTAEDCGGGRFGQLLQALASEHEIEVAGLKDELAALRAAPAPRRPSGQTDFGRRPSDRGAVEFGRRPSDQIGKRSSGQNLEVRGSCQNLEIPEGFFASQGLSEVAKAVRQIRDEFEEKNSARTASDASGRQIHCELSDDQEPLTMTPVMPVAPMLSDGSTVKEADKEENGFVGHTRSVNEVRNRQALDESPSFGSDSDSDDDSEMLERPEQPIRKLPRKQSLIINGTDFNNVLEQKGFELWPVWEGLPVRQSEIQGDRDTNNNTFLFYSDLGGLKTQTTINDFGVHSVGVRFLQRCVTHPRSRWRILWNLMALLIIGIDIIMVPFEVFEPPETRFTASLALSTQLFWNFDIVSNFFVGYWSQAAVVMNLQRIAKNYTSTWFSVDLFLVIVDWIVLALTVNGTDSGAAGLGRIGKSVRYFRFLRSFRLLRLLKMRELMEKMQWSFMSDVVSVRFGIGKMVLVIFIINHLLACSWYGIGRFKFEGRSWLDDFSETSLMMRYTTSFHWSVSQFGVGTAELDAFNTVERSFSIFVGLFALMTFSSIVSSITNLMSHLSSLNDRNRHFSVFRRYCAEHNVSKELLHRMSQYIEYALDHQKRSVAAVDVRLLSLLSEPLYEELQKEIYEPHFQDHPLFKKLCKFYAVAMRSVCASAVTTMFLAPRDLLFRPRQVAGRMFFIVGGTLCYDKDGKVQSIECPSYFSEAVLWTPWLFLGLMEASTPTELVALASDEFAEAIKMHPVTFTRVKRYATHYVDGLKKSPKENLTDLFMESDDGSRMVPSLVMPQDKAARKTWIQRSLRWMSSKLDVARPRSTRRDSLDPLNLPQVAAPDCPAPELPTSDGESEVCSGADDDKPMENKTSSPHATPK